MGVAKLDWAEGTEEEWEDNAGDWEEVLGVLKVILDESLSRLLKSIGVSMLGKRMRDSGWDCGGGGRVVEASRGDPGWWLKMPANSEAELLTLSSR